MTSDLSSPDGDLVRQYRDGDDDAAAELFDRHHPSALRLGQALTDASAAEDLAAEAFSRVLLAIRNGGGPDEAFRPYLLAAVRNAHLSRVRHDQRYVWVDDHERLGDLAAADDDADLRVESSVLAAAFAEIPERWRAVLWHLEVEQDGNQEVAQLLGISPSAVGTLAYRAREGLRQAYLAQHVGATTDVRCRVVRRQLPAYVRGRLRQTAVKRVDQHLDSCATCTGVLADLRQVTHRLPSVLVPTLLGAGATGYLAASPTAGTGAGGAGSGSGSPSAGSGGGAAGAAGGAGGAMGVASAVAAAIVAVAAVGAVALGSHVLPDTDHDSTSSQSGPPPAVTHQPPGSAPTPATPSPDDTPSDGFGTVSRAAAVLVREAAALLPGPSPDTSPPDTSPPDSSPPDPVVPPGHGTTHDLSLTLDPVDRLPFFRLQAGPAGLARVLTVELAAAGGGWNYTQTPGLVCDAATGDLPVTVTCTLDRAHPGVIEIFALDTTGPISMTATVSAPDNLDPDPTDNTVSVVVPAA